MLKQPCGDVLPLGDKCAFASFEDWKGEVIIEVTQKLSIETGSFDEVLERNGNCFYEWRYYYELDVTPANIGFLRALCDSLHPIVEKYMYSSIATN